MPAFATCAVCGNSLADFGPTEPAREWDPKAQSYRPICPGGLDGSRPASLAAVRKTFEAMKLDGIDGVPDDKMIVRRINRMSCLAVYRRRLYVLFDRTGTLDYDKLDRASVGKTEIVGWL